jgi:hypothetical protein
LVLVYGTEDIRAGKFDLRHPARPRDLSVDNCAQISNHGMSRLKLGWIWERRGLAVSLTSKEIIVLLWNFCGCHKECCVCLGGLRTHAYE